MATTKIVSVESTHPFAIRGVYARNIYRQALTIEEIYQCLIQQTSVTEFLPDGTKKRLDLSNYNKSTTIAKQPEPKAEKEPVVKETPKVAPVPETKKEAKPEVKQQQNNAKQQYTAQKTNTNKK